MLNGEEYIKCVKANSLPKKTEIIEKKWDYVFTLFTFFSIVFLIKNIPVVT